MVPLTMIFASMGRSCLISLVNYVYQNTIIKVLHEVFHLSARYIVRVSEELIIKIFVFIHVISKNMDNTAQSYCMQFNINGNNECPKDITTDR